MDPAWISVLVGVASSLITAGVVAAINFAALKSWMARREEREESMREDLRDHETRLRVLERGPLDYAR